MIQCSQWSDCGIPSGGCCAAGHYERPSFGVCLKVCQHYDGPARGLGDTIAKVTKAVGIKPCGGCKKRRRKLNKMVRY